RLSICCSSADQADLAPRSASGGAMCSLNTVWREERLMQQRSETRVGYNGGSAMQLTRGVGGPLQPRHRRASVSVEGQEGAEHAQGRVCVPSPARTCPERAGGGSGGGFRPRGSLRAQYPPQFP